MFGFSVFVLHLLLIFVIGLRFVTPQSANATIVQHTIQLIPRLPDPALVTGVLVEDNTEVKKGQPLFQFDRRPYEYKVAQIEAQVAQAKQNVNVLSADVDVATHKAELTLAQLTYERYEKHAYDIRVAQNSAAAEDVEKWRSRVDVAESSHLEAEAELEGLEPGPDMHSTGVEPQQERLLVAIRTIDEIPGSASILTGW